MTWSQFWSMGGYAPYVWASYGLALVVFAGNVLAALQRGRTSRRALRRRVRQEEAA